MSPICRERPLQARLKPFAIVAQVFSLLVRDAFKGRFGLHHRNGVSEAFTPDTSIGFPDFGRDEPAARVPRDSRWEAWYPTFSRQPDDGFWSENSVRCCARGPWKRLSDAVSDSVRVVPIDCELQLKLGVDVVNVLEYSLILGFGIALTLQRVLAEAVLERLEIGRVVVVGRRHRILSFSADILIDQRSVDVFGQGHKS